MEHPAVEWPSGECPSPIVFEEDAARLAAGLASSADNRWIRGASAPRAA